jgi:hypothetical protein
MFSVLFLSVNSQDGCCFDTPSMSSSISPAVNTWYLLVRRHSLHRRDAAAGAQFVEGRLQAPRDVRVADHHDAHPVSRRQHDLLRVTRVELVQRRNDMAKIQDGVSRAVGLVEDLVCLAFSIAGRGRDSTAHAGSESRESRHPNFSR